MRKWSKAKENTQNHAMIQENSGTNKKFFFIAIYQSGKGYQAISKAVGLQQTTVRDIIHKC